MLNAKCIGILAALALLLNGALAVSTAFSGSCPGPSASSGVKYNLGISDGIAQTSTIGFSDGLEMSVHTSGVLLSGTIPAYHQIDDPNFHAAVYAYLASGDYTYDWDAKISGGTATAWEKISITNAKKPYFGGFAYNSRGDYAASQMIGGEYANGDKYDTVDLYYENKMVASKTMASAYQKITPRKNQGYAYGDLKMASWAEAGGQAYEAKSAIDLWASSDHPNFGPGTTSSLDQMAYQYADLFTGYLLRYQGSSASSASAAIGSESIKAFRIPGSFNVGSNAYKTSSVPFYYIHLWSSGTTVAALDYSTGSKAEASGKLSATQKMKTTGGSVNKWNNANCGTNWLQSSARFVGNGIMDGWNGDFTSTDSATLTKDSASLSENILAKGRYILRGISGPPVNYIGMHAVSAGVGEAYTGSEVGNIGSTSFSTMSGSSVAKFTTKGAVTSLSVVGSWSANPAVGTMVKRSAYAVNALVYADLKITKPGKYSWKEGASSNPITVDVS